MPLPFANPATSHEERWLSLTIWLAEQFGKAPDLNAVLLLIGTQEVQQLDIEFTKEQKQDLMHVATCTLLEPLGHYAFLGKDGDGWPHWRLVERVSSMTLREQEALLRRRVVEYFSERYGEN